jgi:outer membrane protein
MVKKAITLLTMALCISLSSVQAQKIALVDINEVLESLPDYKAAQTEVDRIASEWRQEIAQEYDKIKSMYNKYQAQQVLLSEEAQKQKEDEIVAKETEVRELQRRRFGPEGDLFLKRQELVAPIQEKVFGAIDDFATDRGYDIILDKGGSTGLLFSNAEFDKTEDIKKRLKI